MNTRGLVITAAAAGLIVVGAGVAAVVATAPGADSPRSPIPATAVPAPATSVPAAESAPDGTAASLSYMIEEEKLAHDVYLVLGQTWREYLHQYRPE